MTGSRLKHQTSRSAREYWLESSKWKELEFPAGESTMAVLPVSALVGSVASQYETMESWVARGWCDVQTAKMLAGHPDVEGQAEEDSEDVQYSHWMVDQILDERRVAIPPQLDPATLGRILRVEYLKARRLGAPEPILGEFRRLLDEVARTLAPQEAPPEPAAPNAPPPPLAPAAGSAAA